MNRQEKLGIVTDILVSQFQITPTVINEDSKFGEDLGLDSLHLVEFVQKIEAKFEVDLPDKGLGLVTTVSTLLDFLEESQVSA